MSKYYDPKQLQNAEQVTVNIMPKGYGKCYKEYKEVIDFLENRIKYLEKKRDIILRYIDSNINGINSIIQSTNDIITKNHFKEKMQPYLNIKYLLVRGDSNE